MKPIIEHVIHGQKHCPQNVHIFPHPGKVFWRGNFFFENLTCCARPIAKKASVGNTREGTTKNGQKFFVELEDGSFTVELLVKNGVF